MAEYWGLDAIAARLHVIPRTVLRWYRDKGLLMYKRHPTGPQTGHTQPMWYTNDGLLLAWEIAYAKEWREHVWSAGRKSQPAAQDRHFDKPPVYPPLPDVVPPSERYRK